MLITIPSLNSFFILTLFLSVSSSIILSSSLHPSSTINTPHSIFTHAPSAISGHSSGTLKPSQSESTSYIQTSTSTSTLTSRTLFDTGTNINTKPLKNTQKVLATPTVSVSFSSVNPTMIAGNNNKPSTSTQPSYYLTPTKSTRSHSSTMTASSASPTTMTSRPTPHSPLLPIKKPFTSEKPISSKYLLKSHDFFSLHLSLFYVICIHLYNILFTEWLFFYHPI